MTNSQEIIQKLNLEKHCEGGYFSETYRSTTTLQNADGQQRSCLTSIYYLVTQEDHMSYFAVNKSDLILYYHAGDPMKVIFINAQDEIEEHTLGIDIAASQTPQLLCPAGLWKAYKLQGNNYTLVSEAVAPGFDYEDMYMPTLEDLISAYPQHVDAFKQYIKQPSGS